MLNWQRETENNRGRNESESEEDRVKVKGQKKRFFFFSRVKGGNAEILYVNGMEERLSESEDGRQEKKLLLFFFPDFENMAHILSRDPALKHLFCNYSVGYVRVYACLMPWKRKAKTVTRSIVRWGCAKSESLEISGAYLPPLLFIQYRNHRISQAASSVLTKRPYFPVFSALLLMFVI